MPAKLEAKLTLYAGEKIGGPIPARIFGNFLEHLGYAIDGGILAHALANPTFERDTHLSQEQIHALLEAGQILTRFYEQGCDPDAIPEHWSPGIGATGFGVCALDDAGSHKAPFPWAPLGDAGLVSPAVGRVGGAVRLHGRTWEGALRPGALIPNADGPAGIRQGIFLPFQRCLGYQGSLTLRIANRDEAGSIPSGRIEVGFRRRNAGPGQGLRVGECLALDAREIQGNEWQGVDFRLQLAPGQVRLSEPVDFFIRWLPGGSADLLIDRAILIPTDAVEGIFDPDVLQAVKEWKVPLLRWPGGNFASTYHWRDGTGPFERRPTRPNVCLGRAGNKLFRDVRVYSFLPFGRGGSANYGQYRHRHSGRSGGLGVVLQCGPRYADGEKTRRQRRSAALCGAFVGSGKRSVWLLARRVSRRGRERGAVLRICHSDARGGPGD